MIDHDHGLVPRQLCISTSFHNAFTEGFCRAVLSVLLLTILCTLATVDLTIR